MEEKHVHYIDGKTRRDHVRNGIIRRQLKMDSIRDKLFEGQWRWFKHVSRMTENRFTKRLYEAKGQE